MKKKLRLYNRPPIVLSHPGIKSGDVWKDDIFNRRECAKYSVGDVNVDVPICMRNYSPERFSDWADRVEKFCSGSSDVKSCTMVELKHVAKRLDFISGDFHNHKGIQSGVATVGRGEGE